jgi:hypothetical protein
MFSTSAARMAWIVVAVTTLARLIVAARLPLSGDEAYYWEWSRRLAFGYLDHPPMVAWLIALCTFGVKSVLLVRLPFVLCGFGAGMLLFAFAARATGDPRAGTFAAIVLALAPFATIAFTQAAPDGPELFFWSLSIYCALRALDPATPRWRVPLALAVAATLLSSSLAAFLVLGVTGALALAAVQAAHMERRHSAVARHAFLALVLFTLAVSPYILWDASNGWHATRFALFGRHPYVPGGNLLELLGVLAIVLTPGVFVAIIWLLARLATDRDVVARLVLWTSVPLLVTCLVLATRERVEFNWLDGAMVSLIGGLGFAAARLSRASRGLIIVPAAACTVLLFTVAAFPLESLRVAERTFGLHLRNQGAFEIWAFAPVARDLANAARKDGAMVMTDGYGLSSVLDFYAGVRPVVIGYDAQGREARRWFTGPVTSNAIFLDKEPLASRPDFARQFARACAKVVDLGSRTYSTQGQVTRTFYVTGCEGLTPRGFALLLFPNKSQN